MRADQTDVRVYGLGISVCSAARVGLDVEKQRASGDTGSVQLTMIAKRGGKHDEVPHDANGSDAETG